MFAIFLRRFVCVEIIIKFVFEPLDCENDRKEPGRLNQLPCTPSTLAVWLEIYLAKVDPVSGLLSGSVCFAECAQQREVWESNL
jgi:hypothetical protein